MKKSAHKRSRRHHFVPKALQRRFCFAPDRIFYAERQNGSGVYGKIEPRNIESTFWAKDYYTVLLEEKPSDTVERKFYGALDDYMARLLSEIEATFVAGRIPVFHGDVLVSVQDLVFHFLKRTPDFVKDFDEVALGRQYAEEALFLWEKDGDPDRVSRYRSAMDDNRELQKLGRDIRVRAEISPPSDRVTSALRQLQVRWVQSGGSSSFILSSRMCYRIGNGGPNGFSNPNMEIWMPISPKRALIFLRDDEGRIPIINQVNTQKVREVNEFAVTNSRAVASHSEPLLKSLLGQRRQRSAKLQA